MKQKISIFALTCLLTMSASAFAAEHIYVEGKLAKFRSGPGANYTILWEAPQYTPLEYLAKYKEWYAVRDKDGDVGWVSEQVIGKGKSASVINKKANVRKSPNESAPIAYTVEERYLLRVVELDEKGKWAKVKDAEGDEGWIHVDMIWMSR